MDATWDVQRVGEFPLSRPLSLAIDSRGNAHFVTYDRQGITYWTNASGEWQNERIGAGADGGELDTSPVIAINEAGDVVVAYMRALCSGFGCVDARILVTIRTSSGWSEPVGIAAGMTPQIAVANGAIAVAYVAVDEVDDVACDQPSPIKVALATKSGWRIERVSADGDRPWVALDGNGRPHILIENPCDGLGNAGVYLAEPAHSTGDFAVAPIPDTQSGGNVGYAVGVDANGRTHVVYSRFTDTGDEFVYVVRSDGSWSQPSELIPGHSSQWMAVDQAGHVHVLAIDDGGAWHATDTTGVWTLDQVSPKSGHVAALALDSSGRPHVLLGVGGDLGGRMTVWYGVLTEP